MMTLWATLVVVMVTAMMTLCEGQGQDFTLQEGARGSAVVEAVVEKIRSNCIFSEDRQFLRRAAYVRSRDGADSATYRPNFHGGIWQVTEAMFNATKNCNHYKLKFACGNISDALGIKWPTVTWSDLRKPLYSGVAAALSTLLALNNDTAMSGSLADQAALFVQLYGGSADAFTSQSNLAANVECDVKMDLAFILDSSGSVSTSSFQLMLQFAADVINSMNISRDKVLVANIEYSSFARTQFAFNNYSTKAQARQLMLNTTKEDGGTSTNRGLDEAARVLYDRSVGARDNAKKVAILITDGQSWSFNLTSIAGKNLRDLGTTVFAIGVDSYRLSELQAVASDPICTHVLTLNSFTDIQSILTDIQKSSCEANKVFTNSSTSNAVTQTLVVKVPEKPSVIEAEVSCGVLDIYVSNTTHKPGPAVHDYRYEASSTTGATVLDVTETLAPGTALYVTVVGRPFTGHNCSFAWSLNVTQPAGDVKVICKENGVPRSCTKKDIRKAGLCPKKRKRSIKNPCSRKNLKNGLLRHAHPDDSTMFLLCDLRGRVYEASCPDGEQFNNETRQCGFTSPASPVSSGGNSNDNSNNPTPGAIGNPCDPEAIANGQFYFPYSPDETKFIQCDEWGQSWVMPCAPETVWSQNDYTCVHKGGNSAPSSNTQGDSGGSVTSHPVTSLPAPVASTSPPTLYNGSNPCTEENIENEQFYFTYAPDETKYIQCDEHGKARLMSCEPGTFWSQDHYDCIGKGVSTVKCNDSSDIFVPDPCDQHAYYQCVHGEPLRRECYPSSLFYDTQSKVCAHSNANAVSVGDSCDS